LIRDGRIDDEGMIRIGNLRPTEVEKAVMSVEGSDAKVNEIGLALILELGISIRRDASSWHINFPHW
jgi:hypothetical protein